MGRILAVVDFCLPKPVTWAILSRYLSVKPKFIKKREDFLNLGNCLLPIV